MLTSKTIESLDDEDSDFTACSILGFFFTFEGTILATRLDPPRKYWFPCREIDAGEVIPKQRVQGGQVMSSEAKGSKFGFVGVCLLGFIAFLDFSIIATALPSIQAELHMAVEELQWLVNTYALMLCILMATAGRAADVFGHARVLMFAVLLFGAAPQ